MIRVMYRSSNPVWQLSVGDKAVSLNAIPTKCKVDDSQPQKMAHKFILPAKGKSMAMLRSGFIQNDFKATDTFVNDKTTINGKNY